MRDLDSLLDELAQIGQSAALDRVGEIVHLLRHGVTQDDEALAAIGAIEIERKFLLSALPKHLASATGTFLAQGYLPGERLIERVRKIGDGPDCRYIRTVKLGEGVARVEIEEDCDEAVFDVLWSLTSGSRIEKTRYAVPMGNLVWEVDAFTGQTLFLAELELPSVDTVVEFPDWLAPYIIREVTGERAYTNWALSS